MDHYPISSNSLEKFYYINGNYFGKQYKEHLSGFNDWEQKERAKDWILFPENIGDNLSLDETSLSNGELYTILTNKAGKGKKGSLIAMVEGTISDNVIKILDKIPLKQRSRVKEVPVDMAHSMHRIVKSSFPNAHRVVDRFHVQKLAYDALQEMRIQHRWDAINEATNGMENAKLNHLFGINNPLTAYILLRLTAILSIRAVKDVFLAIERLNETCNTMSLSIFGLFAFTSQGYKP